MRISIEIGPNASKMIEGIPEDEIPKILRDVVEDSLSKRVYVKENDKYIPKDKDKDGEQSKDKSEIMSKLQEILLFMQNNDNVRISTSNRDLEDGDSSSSSSIVFEGENATFDLGDPAFEMFKDLFK